VGPNDARMLLERWVSTSHQADVVTSRTSPTDEQILGWNDRVSFWICVEKIFSKIICLVVDEHTTVLDAAAVMPHIFDSQIS
jgi:hypothetical protein